MRYHPIDNSILNKGSVTLYVNDRLTNNLTAKVCVDLQCSANICVDFSLNNNVAMSQTKNNVNSKCFRRPFLG